MPSPAHTASHLEKVKERNLPHAFGAEFLHRVKRARPAISDDDAFLLRREGLYLDRETDGEIMVRVRVPRGVLTPAQLRTLGQMAVRLGGNRAEITSRQNLQIHGVPLRQIPMVYDLLASVGLQSRGSGGDMMHGIVCCPVAGLEPAERFDVSPVMSTLYQQVADNVAYANLPHMARWNVTACPCHCTVPEIHDGAFVATQLDGRLGFSLWVGGSLAAPARLAQSLGVFIPLELASETLQAVLDIWRLDSEYRVDRSRARFKFLVEDLGVAALRERLEQRLGKRLTRLAEEPAPTGHFTHLGVHDQKQPGLSYLGLPVLAGVLTGDHLLGLAKLVERYGADARLTPDQNLILTGVSRGQLDKVVAELQKTVGLSPRTNGIRGHSTACCGSPACRYTETDTQGGLRELVLHLEHTFGEAVTDLGIGWDGCSNACGHYLISDIGICDARAQRDSTPRYDVFLRGGRTPRPGLGELVLEGILRSDLAPAIERLVRAYVIARTPGQTFREFALKHTKTELVAIARGVRLVPIRVGQG